MQNTTLVWIIVAALIVLGGGWYLLDTQRAAPASVEQNTDAQNNETQGSQSGIEAGADIELGTGGSSEESGAPMAAAVTYSASGFTPSTVIVRVGGTVTWTNESSIPMWVASAQHPTHTMYDSTTLQEHCNNGSSNTFDQCSNGSTYSFTFSKAGTWQYHNHSNASHFGTVIVEE